MTPGHGLLIAVSGTRTGMSPDVLAKAFEPLFTIKPTGAGTGIDLSMVFGFPKLSGGQIRIHLQAGPGTSVSDRLQRHLGEAGPAKITDDR